MNQELFNYMNQEHNVTLLESDIDAIVRIVNSSNEKIIKSIKKIKHRENEVYLKVEFCNEHNFKLEAERLRSISDELQKVTRQLERDFDTGYISLEDEE